MSELDSIENYAKMNGEFDFVITNPPFGNRTFWNKDEKLLEKNTKKVYTLSQNTYWLGVLFIERSINLLKEGGVLVIILPSGYLNNQTLKYIREYLFKYRIIADISLPEGAFKGANTGVKTDILMVKKITPPENYKIFVSVPKKLGFNYHSKNLEMVYKIDEKTGEYLQNEHNENILDDEINEIVSKKFQKFCCDENLEGFEQCKLEKKCVSKSESYDYVSLAEIKKGWEIKKIDRAKQSAERYDIFLSYLLGSKDKFFMILEDKTDNIVVTNGLYKVRINNEKIRLSFFAFLFSKSFEIQFEAFATGHIQTNIVLERVWDFKFPLLNNEGVENWKNYLIQVEKTKKEFGRLVKL